MPPAPASFSIAVDDLSGAGIAALLQAHLDFAAEHTPAGSGHALNLEALKAPELTFWAAWSGGAVVGCIALKDLGGHHGEIKSMHTVRAFRGQGIARALVSHLIEESRVRGYVQLSLETGKSDGFAAARALYQNLGFEPCAPFGDYVADSFSFCMTMQF